MRGASANSSRISIACPADLHREGNVFLVLSAFGREEQAAAHENEIAAALIAQANAIHLASTAARRSTFRAAPPGP